MLFSEHSPLWKDNIWKKSEHFYPLSSFKEQVNVCFSLPVSGILFLVGPKQTSGEAQAGDGEQKRAAVVFEYHFIGPDTWVLSVIHTNDYLRAATTSEGEVVWTDPPTHPRHLRS